MNTVFIIKYFRRTCMSKVKKTLKVKAEAKVESDEKSMILDKESDGKDLINETDGVENKIRIF